MDSFLPAVIIDMIGFQKVIGHLGRIDFWIFKMTAVL